MRRSIAIAVALAVLPCASGQQADNAAGNPRVTRAAFDQIKWLMPTKEIESILGKGESVEDSVVLHAMGSQPGATGEPYDSVEGGLWMKWKGKETTIYIQFAGPNVVRNPDGTYSIGPDTQACMILFITEKSTRMPPIEIRDIHILYKLGLALGEIRHHSKTLTLRIP